MVQTETRRRFLGIAGVFVTAVLAGCGGPGEEEDDPAADDPADDPVDDTEDDDMEDDMDDEDEDDMDDEDDEDA